MIFKIKILDNIFCSKEQELTQRSQSYRCCLALVQQIDGQVINLSSQKYNEERLILEINYLHYLNLKNKTLQIAQWQKNDVYTVEIDERNLEINPNRWGKKYKNNYFYSLILNNFKPNLINIIEKPQEISTKLAAHLIKQEINEGRRDSTFSFPSNQQYQPTNLNQQKLYIYN